MWKVDESEEDCEFTLGINISKSPLDLLEYDLTDIISDLNARQREIEDENVDEKCKSSDENEKNHDNNEDATKDKLYKHTIAQQLKKMKIWMLVNRDAIAILSFLTICLIIGIGIPLSLVYRPPEVIKRPIVYQRNSSISSKKLPIIKLLTYLLTLKIVTIICLVT